MTHNHTRSVHELRRESERTRAELTQTVDRLRDKITDTADDIRHKVSPEHIKAEVSDYVAEKGRHWLDTVKQQAMENPMQALAAGTAIAVPAFKIIRSVPLPLLMIGAGLALASPRVRGAVTEKVSDALKTADGGNIIDDAADTAREGWQSAKARAVGAVNDARDAVTATVAEVRGTAAGLASDARQRAEGLTQAVNEGLSSVPGAVSSKVGSASEAAKDAAKDAFDTTRAKVTETFHSTRASTETFVRDNAAIFGGLGLAIGALIAASLPSSRVEGATLGQASDALKKTAADAASEKFEEVKAAAISAADSAAGKVAEAGIGSRISQAADNAGERLKTVAEDTITTAFEPSQTDHR